MRTRSRGGSERRKPPRHTVKTPKRRNGRKAVRDRKSGATGKDTKIAQLTRELNEALAQQQGTSEAPRAISSSSGDLHPVFAAILANAVAVCDADNGAINRWDGDALHLVATHNMPPAFTELRGRSPY